MRVTVFFYESLDPESVVFRHLRDLFFSYPDAFGIGGGIGFGVEHLAWKDAFILAAKASATIAKCEAESVVYEMRLLVQQDQD